MMMSSSAIARPAYKKYIVVTGGVISGIGKGITASSMGVLLKMLNVRPTAIKIDPYLNIDAGTMSPFEHGETFVLDDGAETDLDLGNYERFLDLKLTNDSNLTTGKVYKSVIEKERRGAYLGKTVQIIPHITNEIIERIEAVAAQVVGGSAAASAAASVATGGGVQDGMEEPDVCVIEMGGTIGDIESMPFVEAIRQLQLKVGRKNLAIVHVSMVPILAKGEQDTGDDGDDGGLLPGRRASRNVEFKTKPTQHSVKELRALGLAPDFIVCRSQVPINLASREKISMFCNLPVAQVVGIHDVPNIYHVPILMLQRNMHTLLFERLGLVDCTVGPSVGSVDAALRDILEKNLDALKLSAGEPREITFPEGLTVNAPQIQQWSEVAQTVDSSSAVVSIALVGKYTDLHDSYLSVISSLRHACIGTKQRLRLVMIESSALEQRAAGHEKAWGKLHAADGILVPGGIGVRGMEGKIAAIRHARTAKVPFLGICLGMQAAVIEYMRAVCGVHEANSEEFRPELPSDKQAIVFMPEGDRTQMGGTMRRGSRQSLLREGSLVRRLYGDAASVWERHRHRYEVNPLLVEALEDAGLHFSGRDETGERMECCELGSGADHPYFVGVQYHPEYQSRPFRPAPVFLGLMQAVQRTRQLQHEHQSDKSREQKFVSE